MKRLSRLLLLIVLVAGACGDDAPAGDRATTTAATGFPVEVRGAMIPVRPERIVSGSATHTEILFALGAGDRLVAVDAFSDFPAEAALIPQFDAFNASVEGIAGLDPDLVILSFDPGDVVDGLTALGIPVVLFAPPGPADLAQVYAEWRDVGTAVGLATEAEALVEEVSGEIAAIVEEVPTYVRPFTYYHELDDTYYSIGSDTFIGSIYGMLTMVSIADQAGGGFPQLSAEFILDADPDFIFLADVDCCGESKETVAARPGWSELSAVQSGRIVELDEGVASRWGPRVVELVRVVAREVHGVGA